MQRLAAVERGLAVSTVADGGVPGDILFCGCCESHPPPLCPARSPHPLPTHCSCSCSGADTASTPFLFGTAGEGITAYSIGADGALTPLSDGKATPAGDNPTYLCANKAGTLLFAACESEPSEVRAFKIDRSPGAQLLTPLNSQPAQGSAACWVTLSPDETHLLAVNYTSGSAISFPVSEAGIGPAASFAPQEGLKPLGPNPNRQDGGHAHCLMFSPTSPSDCYVPDLGMDAVWHYKFSAESGELTLSQETSCDPLPPRTFATQTPSPPSPPPPHPHPHSLRLALTGRRQAAQDGRGRRGDGPAPHLHAPLRPLRLCQQRDRQRRHPGQDRRRDGRHEHRRESCWYLGCILPRVSAMIVRTGPEPLVDARRLDRS